MWGMCQPGRAMYPFSIPLKPFRLHSKQAPCRSLAERKMVWGFGVRGFRVLGFRGSGVTASTYLALGSQSSCSPGTLLTLRIVVLVLGCPVSRCCYVYPCSFAKLG